jgi:tagatose-1,6-bisphosphate aldolase non-catalytic subunit AgaZ/GatZ
VVAGCPFLFEMTTEDKLKAALFALSEVESHLNPLAKALRIAEQNTMGDDADYWRHEISAHEKHSKLIREALK